MTVSRFENGVCTRQCPACQVQIAPLDGDGGGDGWERSERQQRLVMLVVGMLVAMEMLGGGGGGHS